MHVVCTSLKLKQISTSFNIKAYRDQNFCPKWNKMTAKNNPRNSICRSKSSLNLHMNFSNFHDKSDKKRGCYSSEIYRP